MTWMLPLVVALGALLLVKSKLEPPSPNSKTDIERVAKESRISQSTLCREGLYEEARFIYCEVDPARYDITLHHMGNTGLPYGSVRGFIAGQHQEQHNVLLAMNAGMYHKDLSPVGLYIENGEETASVSTRDGYGNFHLKPNGVFFIDQEGRAGVLETAAFEQKRRQLTDEFKPVYATQSGPMLVIDGAIHPRILPNGTSRYIRNGVGVRADGRVVFAITRDPVSFGTFARFFSERAECENALFFDGSVSSIAIDMAMEIESFAPAGPIVSVTSKNDAGTLQQQ